ncbi:pilin [Patescibacteria group bacterium]
MIKKLISSVYAASWSDPSGNDPAKFKDLEAIFENILNVATVLAGIVVFIFLIIGGFKLLFSGGNPESIQKATGTITWAVVGLIILIAVWFIFLFVRQFTGVDVTKFEIPGT